jgi:AraC family transcriptional regulator, arabinose operon regulatory protein
MRLVDQDNDPLVAGLICAHWTEGPGYWTARHKGATSWLAILTLGGSGRFVHREGQFDSQPGDVVLMRPKRMHEYGIAPGNQEWDLMWAHFHLRPHWVNLLQWTVVGPGMMREHLNEADAAVAAVAFQEAIEASQTPGRFSDFLALNYLERALILVASRSAVAQAPKLDSRVRAVIAQMQRELGSPISILDLAKGVDLSESRLAHLFTKETGIPPRRYMENLRLERSKQLLELTDLSIREIAHSLGFSSEFYFSHRFQAMTGERPSVFRSRLRA